MPESLTLASKSAIRAELLTCAGVGFCAEASGVDEALLKDDWLAEGRSMGAIAAGLAEAKARAVVERRGGWVIGADQTLEFDGGLIDKPASLAEARARLLAFRGRPHTLHSAVHLTNGAETWAETAVAVMHVRPFTEAWLDAYLARLGPAALQSVGAYQLEGEGVQLFDRIEGDYFAILGLPLTPLLAALRRFGLLPV